MFTVVNGVLLRPMPFPQPEQLFLVSFVAAGPVHAPTSPGRSAISSPFERATTAFQHLAAFATYKGNLTGAGDPAVILVGSVTAEFFPALQVPPAWAARFFQTMTSRAASGSSC